MKTKPNESLFREQSSNTARMKYAELLEKMAGINIGPVVVVVVVATAAAA